MQNKHAPITLQPLTRCNKEGIPYSRGSKVEAQILRALELDIPSLLERARIRDFKASEFLQEECLIYLIREYQLRGDDHTAGALLEILFKRCAKSIRSKFISLHDSMAREAFDEATASIVDRIIDLGTDKGDFLQVRFWVALERTCVTIYGKYIKEQQRTDRTVSLSHVGESDTENLEEGRSVIDPADEPASPGLSEEQRNMYKQGLNTLEGNPRLAFVLLHYYGWPIESIDPAEPTISGYFKKTPRTIRNWIRSAEEKLRCWREGVKE